MRPGRPDRIGLGDAPRRRHGKADEQAQGRRNPSHAPVRSAQGSEPLGREQGVERNDRHEEPKPGHPVPSGENDHRRVHRERERDQTRAWQPVAHGGQARDETSDAR
jgi:hypothetical protein